MTTAGIRFAYAPLKYAIAVAGAPFGIIVEGYAVLLPPPFERLRMCVRQFKGTWVADHFDSGLAVSFRSPLDPMTPVDQAKAIWAKEPKLCDKSRSGLVESLVVGLQWALENGSLRKRMEHHGYGWCLDEAGL